MQMTNPFTFVRQLWKEWYYHKMMGYCHFPVERRECWEDEYLPSVAMICERALFITRRHFNDLTWQPRGKQ